MDSDSLLDAKKELEKTTVHFIYVLRGLMFLGLKCQRVCQNEAIALSTLEDRITAPWSNVSHEALNAEQLFGACGCLCSACGCLYGACGCLCPIAPCKRL